MKKIEFLDELRQRLSGIPKNEADERIKFYEEMINDRIEDGIPEEEAVLDIGEASSIAEKILSDFYAEKNKNPNKKSKSSAKTLTLLIIGAPLWAPLLISAFEVILALYVSLWACVISLWAAFGALCGGALGGTVGGAVICFSENPPMGILLVAAAFVCAGVGVFLFYGCKGATKYTAKLGVWIIKKAKSIITKGSKEDQKYARKQGEEI